jgi:CDP-diacylglycerol--glycerol-3-phosphate 3-phosphatidyltransferase
MSGISHRFLSLPNLLSLARVPLGGLFWLTLDGQRGLIISFVVLCAAALTDVLDGYVARRRKADGPTGVGSWLDPICDKIFVTLVLAAIYFERRPPLWLLALIMSRELIQLPMSALYRFSPALQHWVHYDFRASALGKAATVMQFLAVGALLLDSPVVTTLAWVTLGVGLAAIADYLRRAIVLARSRR